MDPEATNAESQFRRGMEAARRGDWPAAEHAWKSALEINPCWSAAWNNLANVQRRRAAWAEAEASLLRAIAFAPDDPDYLLSLGHLYRETQQLLQAEACYRNALRLKPKYTAALRGLSELLEQTGHIPAAVAIWETWLEIEPFAAEPLNRLGMVYREREEFDKAEQLWRQSIEQRPHDFAAYGNLGQLLAEQGEEEAARTTYAAGARKQGTPALKILEATVLPVILESEDQITACRQRLADNLDQLHADGVRVDVSRECLPTLFYLAYHGCDDRPLMEKLARLSNTHDRGPQPMPRRPSGKRLRIGVLSHFLRDHTIGRLNVGLIENLSRDKFEVFAIACQRADDPLTQRIQSSADHYTVLPAALPAALQSLQEMRLDILLYADLGMIPFTYTLAHHRVAPVQCVTWGHPVTSGLTTIDYFLSSEALDPPGSERYYTEKLIRLPRLGVYYDPPAPPNPAANREQFGFHAGDHLYGCPQTLFKFHPQFDPLMADILRSDPRGVLVLLEGRHPQWQERLLARWRKSLPDVLSRIRFLPKLARPEFLDLLQVCDVLLDPPVFGGGNTSYEAFGLGVPIVTLPSLFLRSRLSTAMYAQMGLDAHIAPSAAAYAEHAVAIGADPQLRHRLSTSISVAREEIFADQSALRAVEAFLQRVVGA